MGTVIDLAQLFVDIKNSGNQLETITRVDLMTEEVMRCALEAKEIVLQGTNEETVAKAIVMANKIIIGMMIASGDTSLVEISLTKSFEKYTQAVILAVIGAMIREEIL